MKSKIKILIGILVVIVLIVGGWWVWSSYYTCSTIYPELCNRNCNSDVDCYPTCTHACGCIKSGEKCLEDIKCEVAPFSCKCINNICEVVEFGGVTITTDKTEYEQGEIVKITLKNNLDKLIWYLDLELGGWNPWWGLQKLENGSWVEVKVHKPIDGECLIIVREQVPIEKLVTELEVNAERNDTWTLENCVEVSPIGPEIDLKPLALGAYRLFFKYGLNKNNYTEKTIYSNEFTIK